MRSESTGGDTYWLDKVQSLYMCACTVTLMSTSCYLGPVLWPFNVRRNACLETEHFMHGCVPQFLLLDSFKLRPGGAGNSVVLATLKSWGKYNVNCNSVSAFVSDMSQEVVT